MMNERTLLEMTRIADECDARGLFEIANEIDEIVVAKMRTKPLSMLKPTPKRVWEKGEDSMPGTGGGKPWIKKKKKKSKRTSQVDEIDGQTGDPLLKGILERLKDGTASEEDLQLAKQAATSLAITGQPTLGFGVLNLIGEFMKNQGKEGELDLPDEGDSPGNFGRPPGGEYRYPIASNRRIDSSTNRFIDESTNRFADFDEDEIEAAAPFIEMLERQREIPVPEEEEEEDIISPRISMNMGSLPAGYVRQSSRHSNPSSIQREQIMRRMS